MSAQRNRWLRRWPTSRCCTDGLWRWGWWVVGLVLRYHGHNSSTNVIFCNENTKRTRHCNCNQTWLNWAYKNCTVFCLHLQAATLDNGQETPQASNSDSDTDEEQNVHMSLRYRIVISPGLSRRIWCELAKKHFSDSWTNWGMNCNSWTNLVWASPQGNNALVQFVQKFTNLSRQFNSSLVLRGLLGPIYTGDELSFVPNWAKELSLRCMAVHPLKPARIPIGLSCGWPLISPKLWAATPRHCNPIPARDTGCWGLFHLRAALFVFKLQWWLSPTSPFIVQINFKILSAVYFLCLCSQLSDDDLLRICGGRTAHKWVFWLFLDDWLCSLFSSATLWIFWALWSHVRVVVGDPQAGRGASRPEWE